MNQPVEKYKTRGGILVEVWKTGIGEYTAVGYLFKDKETVSRVGLTAQEAKNRLTKALQAYKKIG